MIGKELLKQTLSSIKQYIDSIEKKLEIDIDNLHFDVTDIVENKNQNAVTSNAVYNCILANKGQLQTITSAPVKNVDLSNNWYKFAKIEPNSQPTIYFTLGGLVQGTEADPSDFGLFNLRIGYNRGDFPSMQNIDIIPYTNTLSPKYNNIYVSALWLVNNVNNNLFKVYYEVSNNNFCRLYIVCQPKIQNSSLEIKLLTKDFVQSKTTLSVDGFEEENLMTIHKVGDIVDGSKITACGFIDFK